MCVVQTLDEVCRIHPPSVLLSPGATVQQVGGLERNIITIIVIIIIVVNDIVSSLLLRVEMEVNEELGLLRNIHQHLHGSFTPCLHFPFFIF